MILIMKVKIKKTHTVTLCLRNVHNKMSLTSSCGYLWEGGGRGKKK